MIKKSLSVFKGKKSKDSQLNNTKEKESFVDEKIDVVRFIVVNMESLADNVKYHIDHKDLEYVHKCLPRYTLIFTNNIYSTKIIFILASTVRLKKKKDIVNVKFDKGSSIVIMKKSHYLNKLDTVIHDDIITDTCIETTDNRLKELS